MDGEAVRATWEAEAESAGMPTQQTPSAFGWAEEFLAGYGIFLRDGQEKSFSRVLDILAERDFGGRQAILGPAVAGSKGRCARWRSSGAIAGILRPAWRAASPEQQLQLRTWEPAARQIRQLSTKGAPITAARIVAAVRQVVAQRRMNKSTMVRAPPSKALRPPQTQVPEAVLTLYGVHLAN